LNAGAVDRQVSRATIKISNAEEGCLSRQVEISGTLDSVDNALYLINAIQAKYAKNWRTLELRHGITVVDAQPSNCSHIYVLCTLLHSASFPFSTLPEARLL